MKIGAVEFGKYPVFAAPMEDVSEASIRYMCKKFGADLLSSEFAASDAIVRSVNQTMRKLKSYEYERPFVVQIFGKNSETMAQAAKIVESEFKPDIIDINFGCPVKKIAGKGAGAGLLQNSPLMIDIAQSVVNAVHTPVTAKTRLGWDSNNMPIVSISEQLPDVGIHALTIHGRPRAQMYTGEADWSLIGEVKKNPRIHIPIIGNGDITTPEQTKEAFDKYGVDAVMVGRATFGRPWIFKEIHDYLEGKDTDPAMTFDWKLKVLEEQLRINVERIDEYRGILHTRRHLAASPIFKGIPDFRPTRIAMLRANTVDELTAILEDVRKIFLLPPVHTVPLQEDACNDRT